ncbi:TIGR03943 family protein [Microbacterium betulae]|uniref:TIGR03943 family protein n=1 Tax=Microbacterium betulae TaxID=2981139 RepID=A0AA97FH78_9MICO|nr:TIGR03943 family protein [Microbacterium sp. AB]WOF22945.1 TIGR03943 family protein [Microbacterium sp. AB]
MHALTDRWLGVGLAAVLAVVTLSLAVTGRLQLYIDPAQAWFAVGMAVIALAGAVCSFALPLGAEGDHGHDHGEASTEGTGRSDADARGPRAAMRARRAPVARRGVVPSGVPVADAGLRDGRAARRSPPRRIAGGVAVAVGGVAASAVAVAALVLPPAPLSVELAMDRDTGTPPLFAGDDSADLAASGDTGAFGIGEWSSVFATATHPETFAGQQVTLTGFVTPDDENPDGLLLGRLVVTHCVIDAQPASVPVSAPGGTGDHAVGDWIEVQGTIRADASGALTIEPESITAVDAPEDPYEY